MTKTIEIEGVTIYVSEQQEFYSTEYLTLEPVDSATAHRLWTQGKTYRSHSWDFWGESVYQFNYVDEEHREQIVKFLVESGVGKKRAKRVTDELIRNHSCYEDLQGVKMD